ncbi:hypothetical protein ABFY27_15820 [Akkermansia massiliensis]
MTTITKSRFARRSLALCGVAGAAVIWLMLTLVNLQLVSPGKRAESPAAALLNGRFSCPSAAASWTPMRRSSPTTCRVPS